MSNGIVEGRARRTRLGFSFASTCLALATVVVGCGSSPKTGRLEVTVEVDPALMLSSVQVKALAVGKPPLAREIATAGLTTVTWPIQISNPGSGLMVGLEATGSPPAGGTVTYNVVAFVSAGQTVPATLRLTKDCLAGPACGLDQTCDHGACIKRPTYGGVADAAVMTDEQMPPKTDAASDGGTGTEDAADSGNTTPDAGPDVETDGGGTCGTPADPKNCGTCGHDCTALPNLASGASGIECRAGACYVPAAACATGFGHCSTRADDGCEVSLVDAQNCGACGTKCSGATALCTTTATGPKCVASCVAPTPDLCASSCVDLKVDPKNCGACGHDCAGLPNVKPNASGIECRAGACYLPPAACSTGFGHCSMRADDGCETDLKTPEHCGSCTKACATPTGLCSTTGATPTCSSSCAAPSPDLCGSKCVDFKSDPTNCGACNHNCTLLPGVKSGATGVECRSGACYVPPSACSSGRAHCSNNADDGCEADLTTPAHCGSCSLVCSGTTPLCSTQSTPAMCLPSCSGTSPDVCGTKCVNVKTDIKNCGTCGHDCTALPNVKAGAAAPAVQCVAGACVLQPAACVSGFGHCSTNADAGCETDLTRPQTCGSCTNACMAPTALCSTASGTPTCSSSCTTPNPDLCGSKCVDRKTDPTNCGTCGHDCTALPHLKANAAVTCNASGGCVIPQSACAAGWANCTTGGTNDTDGCETQTNTLTNCGGCGVTCSQPNATATCTTGTCAIASCNSGYDDCTSAAGCETQVNTAQNCGMCGKTCTGGTPTCSSGTCVCASPKAQYCGTGSSAMCCAAPSDPNSMISCAAGTSCATQCKTGYHACNGTVTPCYGDTDVQHCSGGCLDCRQPNANAACGAIGATQCANTCIGTTLACPGVAAKPTCGSWAFESNTVEGWINSSGNLGGGDGSGGQFSTTSARAGTGTYSVSIGHRHTASSVSAFSAILVNLCPNTQSINLSQRSLSLNMYYLPTDASLADPLQLEVDGQFFIRIHNATNHDNDGVGDVSVIWTPNSGNLPMRTWSQGMVPSLNANGGGGSITAIEIVFVTYDAKWNGTIYLDDIRIQ